MGIFSKIKKAIKYKAAVRNSAASEEKPVNVNTEKHSEVVRFLVKKSGFNEAVRHLVSTYHYTYATAERIVARHQRISLVDSLEILDLLLKTPGQKIGAVRLVKNKYRISLKEAKEVVDSISRRYLE